MKILIIPGLTLPEVSNHDLARIHDAAGPGADIVVTEPREAADHAADTDVILGFISPSLFAATSRLKWVHAIASGVDAFLFPAFKDSDVILTSEKGLVGEHLADHGFGLLLMLTRQLATAQRLGADAWNHRPEMRRKEVELTGLTLGCVERHRCAARAPGNVRRGCHLLPTDTGDTGYAQRGRLRADEGHGVPGQRHPR
jgi:phosphoglycerate dehydrogenase-like enzyme